MTPAKSPTGEPIDAVYLWSGTGDLRYAVRSLGRYAPWIRKVHVVTAGEAPKWLARPRERLVLVKHWDLIRDTTATANAITWRLFRIPELARRFVLLDETLFLGAPLEAADFLTAKGGYRFFTASGDIPAGDAAEALLNARFGNRSPRKQVAPTPRLLDRNFLEEVNRLWEKQIKQGGVSMETLYFYFLSDNPLQRGVHEKIPVTDEVYGRVPMSDAGQVGAMLKGGRKFFSLEGQPSFAARVRLMLRYWRRSVFEK